jgi:hypothetical protein
VFESSFIQIKINQFIATQENHQLVDGPTDIYLDDGPSLMAAGLGKGTLAKVP